MLVKDLEAKSVKSPLDPVFLPSASYLLVMPQDDLCLRAPCKHLNHLVASHPVVMVSGQPALRMTILIVLPDMVLIGGKDPCPGLGQVDLQDAETRGVARRMAQGEALGDLEEVT